MYPCIGGPPANLLAIIFCFQRALVVALGIMFVGDEPVCPLCQEKPLESMGIPLGHRRASELFQPSHSLQVVTATSLGHGPCLWIPFRGEAATGRAIFLAVFPVLELVSLMNQWCAHIGNKEKKLVPVPSTPL